MENSISVYELGGIYNLGEMVTLYYEYLLDFPEWLRKDQSLAVSNWLYNNEEHYRFDVVVCPKTHMGPETSLIVVFNDDSARILFKLAIGL